MVWFSQKVFRTMFKEMNSDTASLVPARPTALETLYRICQLSVCALTIDGI
jgi:hypothetical protein